MRKIDYLLCHGLENALNRLGMKNWHFDYVILSKKTITTTESTINKLT